MLSLFRKNIYPYIKGFLHLFYPQICLHCGSENLTKLVLCESCFSQLPYSHFFSLPENPVEKIFWGRIKIGPSGAALFFTKDSIVQLLIFELKYKKNKKAGWLFGNIIGEALRKSGHYNCIDYIIPIPIRRRKERLRGFNQSFIICEGIIKQFPLPILKNVLIKNKDIGTQTHKDRMLRGKNSATLFSLENEQFILNKGILIVDDVITTGATLEAACICLQLGQPRQIQLAAAAYTLS